MNENNWEQIGQNAKPNKNLFDSFYPGLISKLSPFWKIAAKLKNENKEKIDALPEDYYIPAEPSCQIF